MATFSPKASIVNMSSDDVDEQILFNMNDISDRNITEDDITDEMRQKFVDFSWELMFDGISNGEDWYGNNIIKRTQQMFD